MKSIAGKIVVVVCSLGLGAGYVWYSSTKDKAEVQAQNSTDSPSVMVEEPESIVVTDEEVTRMRESMLSTSKSGLVMSHEDVRAMLHKQKVAERVTPGQLIGGSKSITIVKPELLLSSSKNPSVVIAPEDLKKNAEGKGDFVNPHAPKDPAHEEPAKGSIPEIQARSLSPSSKVRDMASPEEVKQLEEEAREKLEKILEEKAKVQK